MERDKRIDELIKKLEELKKKAEELKRKLEERKKPPVKPPEFKEVLRRLELEYEAYLAEHGVTNPRKCIEYVKEDIESLAEAVVKGELSFDEALHRVREIGIPPIARFRRVPGIPTAERLPERALPEIPPEEVEEIREAFVTPREAADIIWNRYLADLLNFGLRWVFENYGREFGMTEGMLNRVATILAARIRKLGIELVNKGRELDKGRYIWAGEALLRYPFEVVWNGCFYAIKMHSPNIWPQVRVFGELYKALGGEGILKALQGVVYKYLNIPEEEWPSDVLSYYMTYEEVAGVDP